MSQGSDPELIILLESYISWEVIERHQMIRVKLSGQLGDFTGGAHEVKVDSAPTILKLVYELEERFPGIRGRILDDQEKARPYVNIFVDGENIRETGKEKTRLADGNLVYILPSVAGG
jgi:sulfur-carrier protein